MTADDERWRAATHAGNEEDRLRRVAAATPAQRLAWLEQALALAYRSGALTPARREAAGGEGTGPPDDG